MEDRPIEDWEYPDPDCESDDVETLPCPECGCEVYEESVSCPRCGHFFTLADRVAPSPGKKMLGIVIAILMIALIVFAWVA